MRIKGNHKFTQWAKKRLIDMGITVTELARQIDRPRSTVSRSINSGVFPQVRELISQALDPNK